MTEDRRNSIWLFLACLTIQLLLLAYFSSEIELLASNNGDVHILQYLPQETVTNHPWLSFYYLQQSPPIPQLIMTVVDVLTHNMYQKVMLLVLISIMCLCSTCYLLYRIFLNEHFSPGFSAVLVLFFACNLDVFMLQFSYLGQVFYEFVSMFLVTAMLYCVHQVSLHTRLPNKQSAEKSRSEKFSRHLLYCIFLLGLISAALALTRSSCSYIFVIPLLFLFVQKHYRRPKIFILFLLPVAILQGGWALKQVMAYGEFRWETSSWGGLSLNQSVYFRGAQPDAVRHYMIHRDRQANWFNQLMDSQPQPLMIYYPDLANYVPEATAREDQRIAELLGSRNAERNTAATALLSDTYKSLYLDYMASHWKQTIALTYKSYQLFWLPIRNYMKGNHATLLYIDDEVDIPISISRAAGEVRDFSSDLHVNTATIARGINVHPPESHRQLEVGVWSFLSLAFLQFNFIIIHIGPALLIFAAMRKPICSQTKRQFLLVFIGYLLLLYLGGLSSLVEYGENMRFRIILEPALWLMSILILGIFLRAFSRDRFNET